MYKTVIKNLSLFFERDPSKKSPLCKPCVCEPDITCPTCVKQCVFSALIKPETRPEI